MDYKYILFDLDGTLTDSAPGIINSVIYALKKYNIEVTDRAQLYKFVGPPLIDSFQKHYGFSKEKAEEALDYYRERYRDKGIFENLVYDGLENLLKALKRSNKTLIVATSKPQIFAERVLDHFNITKYFTYIAGSTLDGTRERKGDVIKYALENCGIMDLSEVIMIGDREHDIIGAKEAGVSSMGVLYGYGDRRELETAGADFIATTIEDIEKLLLVS